MILDTLANAARYDALHPLFARAFEYLEENDIELLPVGTHEIAGRDLYVNVIQAAGQGHTAQLLEAHRDYIDIHVTLDGIDEIGWRPIEECRDIATAYSEEKDVLFLGDAPTLFAPVVTGSFAIFYPEDAHAPMAGSAAVHKVVFKIRLSDD